MSVLKIFVEAGGGSKTYIGFVEIDRGTTLAQLRSIISRTLDVDSVPAHYQFVRGDGLLVGSRGEYNLLASRFLPNATLIPTPESPIAGKRIDVGWLRHVHAALIAVRLWFLATTFTPH
jgi:hypothetical protein